MPSQPARAVWIEILPLPGIWHRLESQPARAVWIEIFAAPGFDDSGVVSQPARAVWIEISLVLQDEKSTPCHSLRGLCGLKFIFT